MRWHNDGTDGGRASRRLAVGILFLQETRPGLWLCFAGSLLAVTTTQLVITDHYTHAFNMQTPKAAGAELSAVAGADDGMAKPDSAASPQVTELEVSSVTS